MNEFLHDKSALRPQLRARRDALPPGDRRAWSDAITAHLLARPEVRAARRVFCYVSIGSEVDTRRLLADLLAAGKRVGVPRLVAPGRMVAHPIASLEELHPGRFGIPEPPGPPGPPGAVSPGLPPLTPDVVLVPGLAFTAAGDRLGMGAGYYDRYLATHPGVASLGLCFPPLLLDHLPVEPHDVPVTRVITPSGPA